MRTILLFAFSLLFLSSGFAQKQQGEDSLEELLCDMSELDQSNKRHSDFKKFCSRLYALYPKAHHWAKHEFAKKLFLNKMHRVLKRGTAWDTMTGAVRDQTAKDAVQYVIDFLKYEPGDKLKRPDTYKLDGPSGKPCKLKELEYTDARRCREDANYQVLTVITDKGIGVSDRFWAVLVYMTRKIKCDSGS